MAEYRNPAPTVDIIIELDGGIVLIERKNDPPGWALPGGFVDYGETLEKAAAREAEEETSLKVRLKCQMHAYSDPLRDQRKHTLSVVFVAEASGTPEARDDAREVGVFTEKTLPSPIAFDHSRILADYFRWRREGWGVFDFDKKDA
ncbi:ADP-ribose pyrophosphatase [Geobacteraceae bacterium]|nr:ADP-ribose pyrophosphatase [Geobacteraceae bacterium]